MRSGHTLVLTNGTIYPRTVERRTCNGLVIEDGRVRATLAAPPGGGLPRSPPIDLGGGAGVPGPPTARPTRRGACRTAFGASKRALRPLRRESGFSGMAGIRMTGEGSVTPAT